MKSGKKLYYFILKAKNIKKYTKHFMTKEETFKLGKVVLNNYFKHKLNLTFKKYRFHTTIQNISAFVIF